MGEIGIKRNVEFLAKAMSELRLALLDVASLTSEVSKRPKAWYSIITPGYSRVSNCG